MAIDWTKTQVGQGLIPQEQEALRWARQFLAGQIPLTGMSNAQIRDLTNLATWLQENYGAGMDLSGVYKGYIEPILTGTVPTSLRDAAMKYLAAQAASTGQIPQALASYLGAGPSIIPSIQSRADILTQLANAGLYTEPTFQQAFQGFLGQVAPGGQVRGGAPVWEAVAAPYYALKEVAPDLVSQFGEVRFPTTTTGMSRYARQVAENVARSGLTAQGTYAGPYGFVGETPRQRTERVVGAFPELFREYGQNVVSAAPASPADLGTPGASLPFALSAIRETTPTAGPTVPAQPAPAPAQPAKAAAPTGGEGVQKPTPEAQRQIVEGIKTTLLQNYPNRTEARRALQNDEPRLRQLLDDSLIQELYNFVDSLAWWK